MIDYMVMEAVALKVREEEREAARQRQIEEWKQSAQQDLKQYT